MITAGVMFNSGDCNLTSLFDNMGVYNEHIMPILYMPNSVFTFFMRESNGDDIILYTAVLSTDYPLVYNHGCYGSRYKDDEYRTTEVALEEAYEELLKEGVI
jgi:hypothetical protein